MSVPTDLLPEDSNKNNHFVLPVTTLTNDANTTQVDRLGMTAVRALDNQVRRKLIIKQKKGTQDFLSETHDSNQFT